MVIDRKRTFTSFEESVAGACVLFALAVNNGKLLLAKKKRYSVYGRKVGVAEGEVVRTKENRDPGNVAPAGAWVLTRLDEEQNAVQAEDGGADIWCVNEQTLCSTYECSETILQAGAGIVCSVAGKG